jgi:integrase
MTARRGRDEGALYFSHDTGKPCRDAHRDEDKRTHQRCSGHWTGVVDLGLTAEGKRERRKVSARTKSEAREKLDALRAEKARTGTVVSGALTVGELVRELMANPPEEWASATTRRVNQDHADRIVAALGTVRVRELDANQVETFLRGLARPARKRAAYSRSVIVGTRSVLRRALRKAEKTGGLVQNVAGLADIPKTKKTRVSRDMTLDEMRQLLASDLSVWWRAYCSAAVMTGLRPGELAGLTWDDVDFDAGVIRVRHALHAEEPEAGYGRGESRTFVVADLKTEQSKRTLTMPADVVAALKALRALQAGQRLRLGEAYQDHGLVFCSAGGAPKDRQGINAGFAACCARAGLPRFQPRETRHTFVSIASHSGVSIEEIADAVGHVNSNITKIVYRHQLRDEISTAATVFDGLAGEQQTGETGS